MNAKFFDLKQEKQDRMVNAALKVFALNGYQHASTDDIVKEAHISKGLLFHYFDSKNFAWKEYLCNTLKYADIKKYRKMSSFSTFNSKEDSGPYKHLMRHVIIKMLILPLKKILKGRNIHQRMTKYHEV